MRTSEIRKLFLEYFSNNNHQVVPSSSLVPKDDPSLLFTSAGMVQFKAIFLGQQDVPYKRATSSQKCLRAGGKHNDLENVGFTSRHHTFFEMLGNFSFGDYFKEEAIYYAWEFVTKYLKIDATKLWITVYEDDQEAEDIWLNKIKIDKNKFSKCDALENFWSMGETGPCGPCSEIYYDRGQDFLGEPPGFGDPGERYIEIYNLVFMQYNRNNAGELHSLPKPCVDTGMGLERVATVMQGVNSNYEIDIFAALIKNIIKLFNITDVTHASVKVIADHLRACSFLVIDGITPANEGRGYVLRRIMRRAIRHGYKLGLTEPFFYLLVKDLVKIMGSDFPELINNQNHIERIFLAEEQQFAKTLEHGMRLLDKVINNNINIINGYTVFKLYDTYGFPVDLIQDIAKEHNMQLDLAGFEQYMLEQKTRARAANKFVDLNLDLENLMATKFVGYEVNKIEAEILQIFDNNKIILNATPFYANSGGQIGDTGVLLGVNNNCKFMVTDTRKIGDSHIIHEGYVASGNLNIGDTVIAEIDNNRRQQIKLNHSATHLLHAALRTVLGEHVKQKGSLVAEDRLRFDFEHSMPLTKIELYTIQNLVNNKIRENLATAIEIMPIKEAMNKGAMALFNEKYQDEVRVLNIAGDFSVELCGGTHVERTGDIGSFIILKEESIASGVRRIEAITGVAAIDYIDKQQQLNTEINKILNIADDNLINAKILQLLEQNKSLTKQLDLLEKNNLDNQIALLTDKYAVNLANNIKLLITKVNISPKYLKVTMDKLKQNLKSAIIILAVEYNNKAMFITGVTKDLIDKTSAIELIKIIMPLVDGKGGGRADLAEGSGTKVSGIEAALAVGYNKIMEKYGN